VGIFGAVAKPYDSPRLAEDTYHPDSKKKIKFANTNAAGALGRYAIAHRQVEHRP
jgi:hypothetical protein